MAKQVYVVMSNNELMSVCGDEQTAKWEKEIMELDGQKNVIIRKCGVVSYDEDYHKRYLQAIKELSENKGIEHMTKNDYLNSLLENGEEKVPHSYVMDILFMLLYMFLDAKTVKLDENYTKIILV